jgi:hypothetical protein
MGLFTPGDAHVADLPCARHPGRGRGLLAQPPRRTAAEADVAPSPDAVRGGPRRRGGRGDAPGDDGAALRRPRGRRARPARRARRGRRRDAADDAPDAADAADARTRPTQRTPPTQPDAADVRVDACPSGRTRCGELCADTQVDLQHCGGCGRRCAGRADLRRRPLRVPDRRRRLRRRRGQRLRGRHPQRRHPLRRLPGGVRAAQRDGGVRGRAVLRRPLRRGLRRLRRQRGQRVRGRHAHRGLALRVVRGAVRVAAQRLPRVHRRRLRDVVPHGLPGLRRQRGQRLRGRARHQLRPTAAAATAACDVGPRLHRRATARRATSCMAPAARLRARLRRPAAPTRATAACAGGVCGMGQTCVAGHLPVPRGPVRVRDGVHQPHDRPAQLRRMRGRVCPTGASCSAAAAPAPRARPPAPAAASTPATTIANCGACGRACAVSGACVGGNCICGGRDQACCLVGALRRRGSRCSWGVCRVAHAAALRWRHRATRAPSRPPWSPFPPTDPAGAPPPPSPALAQFHASLAARRARATPVLLAAIVALFALQSYWGDGGGVASSVRMGAVAPGEAYGQPWRPPRVRAPPRQPPAPRGQRAEPPLARDVLRAAAGDGALPARSSRWPPSAAASPRARSAPSR